LQDTILNVPIYEYEPVGRDCLICNNRLELMQKVSEEPLTVCPYCGMEIRRVISRAQFQLKVPTDPDRAAQRGFVTYKKADKDTWELAAGEGPKEIRRRPGKKAEDDSPDEPGELRVRE